MISGGGGGGGGLVCPTRHSKLIFNLLATQELTCFLKCIVAMLRGDLTTSGAPCFFCFFNSKSLPSHHCAREGVIKCPHVRNNNRYRQLPQTL